MGYLGMGMGRIFIKGEDQGITSNNGRVDGVLPY